MNLEQPGKSRIFLSPPDVGATEKEMMNEAFDSNWIAPLGPYVERFERDLSTHMGGLPVVVLSSGTAAIHLALVKLGVGPNDIVLVQSFTFCASANPVKYLGAEPIFVGSEPDTWNMCPDSLELAITSSLSKGVRPKAVILVHLYGVPAKLALLQKVATKYEIPILEDAAESLGAKYFDRPTGTFGSFGILSFNGNKIITTSGGGALVCQTSGDYDAVKHLATQAREKAPFYLHKEIGFNYRLSNISAAIGVAQLGYLEPKVKRRREICARYREKLGDLLHFPNSQTGNFENRWLTVATLPGTVNTLELIAQLEEKNIECRPLWKPLHTQPVFSGSAYFGTKLEEDLFQNGICLPSGSSLSEADQDFVISEIRDLISK
jgi:dTDP-4-amino-4,6-dideoxygalactose transaminase